MLIILLSLFFIQSQPASVPVQSNESLHEIFQLIEKGTGYKFLYRDALIAGKDADFIMGDDWRESLISLLENVDLEASVDDERRRVVIYKKTEPSDTEMEISGYVIDNKSGERLPFATVSWKRGDNPIKSTQTNINGRFTVPISSDTGTLTVHVSYVGYLPSDQEFSLRSLSGNETINIRLAPSLVEISEILVTGSSNSSPADSVYRGILDVGTFSPLGESNSVRMLQVLPSVSHGSSLAEGSYIRGSNSDALQVLLDGSVIYNHSHLFGLIDSFNPDVIRTGSFYYDVAPARYNAPPGGVLNLVTQTGSLHEYGGSFGLSNAVIKGSIDGPIRKGHSSWMLAGRHSLLNTMNLFDTAGMVSWGLDIDRETSLPDDAMDLNERIETPGSYSVQFYDLHSKLFFEQDEKSSWTVSGYLGGDNTSQVSERITQAGSNSPRRFDRSDFETKNSWGNRSANISYFRTLTGDRMIHLQGGFSYLYTSYLKEDYIYQRPGQEPDRPPLFLNDFENESELNHGYFTAEFETGQYTVGATLNLYDSAYLEQSLNRAEFFQRTRPVMPELFAEYRLGDVNTGYSVNAGVRLQHYSDGNFTNLTPRIKAGFLQNSPVSIGISAGRNYQYLYSLSIYNQTTSDIWIMALDGQPPAQSDHLSASVSTQPWRSAYLQVEGYLKRQKNLRFHEINFQNVESTFGGNPWFIDNDGFSRGLEVMFRQSLGNADITQTYTYSVTELKNNRFRNGEWFYAEWDRRHRFSTIASYQITKGLKASINWIYSTGRPDRIRLDEENQDRLGSYTRLDLSIGYSGTLGNNNLRVQAGVYNLTDQKNPWYREWVQRIDRSGVRPQLTPELVDVYDLGIQPSVSVGIYF
jgi:hypothetical protein